MLSPELTKQASELTDAQIPYVVATVVRAQSPTAGKPGDKALVTADGGIYGWIGGGCAQPAVIKTARKVIESQEPALIRVQPGKEVEVDNGIVSFKSSCPSGGTLDIFVEPVLVRPVLWIFGSSPVAIKLAELASVADYDVRVAAPFGEAEQFARASVFQTEFDTIQAYQGTCYAVVATQGKRDIAALKASLNLASRFIGFVASSKKAIKYKQDLLDKGYSKDQVERICSPVGIDMVAKTPAEIAVSILAQLVQTKYAEKYTENGPEETDNSATSGELNREEKAVQLSTAPSDSDASEGGGGCCGG